MQIRVQACPASRVGMRDHALISHRLNQLLLLDTEAASEREVVEHLERYNEALSRIGESVRLRTPVRRLVASDVCAALVAMPDELQLKILDHLSDYDIVALLACRKTPCFSESTCDELLKKFPTANHRRDLHDDESCWWRSKLAGAFDRPYQELCPFRELRRRSYRLGISFFYAVSTDHADPTTMSRWTRWTSQDVPGDTIKVADVATRLEPPRFLQNGRTGILAGEVRPTRAARGAVGMGLRAATVVPAPGARYRAGKSHNRSIGKPLGQVVALQRLEEKRTLMRPTFRLGVGCARTNTIGRRYALLTTRVTAKDCANPRTQTSPANRASTCTTTRSSVTDSTNCCF